MIAISFHFVCMLCDCFKSRRRLEAEILGIAASAQCSAAARTTTIAFALGRLPCSFGSIVAVLAFLTP